MRWAFWVAGVATSAVGVALVRLVVPHLGAPAALAVYGLGVVLAVAGLVIIVFGLSRRYRNPSA